MKNLIMIAASMFLFGTLCAQVKVSKEFSFSVSDPYQVVDGDKYYFSKEGEVLSVKRIRGGYVLQKFAGDKLNEVERNEDDYIPDGFQLEGFMEIDERYYMFYSIYDRPNVTEQLFVREIDFESAKFKDKGRLLFKVKGKVSGTMVSAAGGWGMKKVDKFSFYTTYDDSKLIVQYRLVPEEKRDALNKDKIGMYVFNGGMEEIWNDNVEMPYTEKKMNNIGYAVDKKGNGFILAEVFKDETTKRIDKEGNPNYNLELIRIDGDDREVSTSSVELKDKFIKDLGFFEGANDEIVVAGYYGKDRRGGTEGVFLFKLDEDGEVIESKDYEVPVEVMSMYMSERAQEKMKDRDEKRGVSMPSMVLREIVHFSDGSVTVIGEKFYITEHYNSKTGTTTYTYHYHEVLMTHINGDGELMWMKKLPKRQTGGSYRGGMSYFHMTGDGYQYVLFLDNVKNMDLALTEVPAGHRDGRGGYLTGFKVDNASGELEKVSIFDITDVNGIALHQFATYRIVQLSDNEFALESYKKKKEDVMVKVTLKD